MDMMKEVKEHNKHNTIENLTSIKEEGKTVEDKDNGNLHGDKKMEKDTGAQKEAEKNDEAAAAAAAAADDDDDDDDDDDYLVINIIEPSKVKESSHHLIKDEEEKNNDPHEEARRKGKQETCSDTETQHVACKTEETKIEGRINTPDVTLAKVDKHVGDTEAHKLTPTTGKNDFKTKIVPEQMTCITEELVSSYNQIDLTEMHEGEETPEENEHMDEAEVKKMDTGETHELNVNKNIEEYIQDHNVPGVKKGKVVYKDIYEEILAPKNVKRSNEDGVHSRSAIDIEVEESTEPKGIIDMTKGKEFTEAVGKQTTTHTKEEKKKRKVVYKDIYEEILAHKNVKRSNEDGVHSRSAIDIEVEESTAQKGIIDMTKGNVFTEAVGKQTTTHTKEEKKKGKVVYKDIYEEILAHKNVKRSNEDGVHSRSAIDVEVEESTAQKGIIDMSKGNVFTEAVGKQTTTHTKEEKKTKENPRVLHHLPIATENSHVEDHIAIGDGETEDEEDKEDNESTEEVEGVHEGNKKEKELEEDENKAFKHKMASNKATEDYDEDYSSKDSLKMLNEIKDFNNGHFKKIHHSIQEMKLSNELLLNQLKESITHVGERIDDSPTEMSSVQNSTPELREISSTEKRNPVEHTTTEQFIPIVARGKYPDDEEIVKGTSTDKAELLPYMEDREFKRRRNGGFVVRDSREFYFIHK